MKQEERGSKEREESTRGEERRGHRFEEKNKERQGSAKISKGIAITAAQALLASRRGSRTLPPPSTSRFSQPPLQSRFRLTSAHRS